MLPIRFSKRAEREIETARAWWLENRPKAPEAFDEDLELTLNLIGATLAVGLSFEGSLEQRRIALRRTRYWLYYEQRDERILILAL